MVGPIDIAYAFLGGLLAGPLLVLLFAPTLMLYDLQGYVKDDVPVHRRIWTTVTIGPKHIYHQTDWEFISSVLPKAALVCATALPILVIFGVGLVEVFM